MKREITSISPRIPFTRLLEIISDFPLEIYAGDIKIRVDEDSKSIKGNEIRAMRYITKALESFAKSAENLTQKIEKAKKDLD